ncbi:MULTISPECIES: alpha/beta fold hydrolase [unclassified Nocardia]|uniref:alpha/beta fold hydrolase n=1 Tax=unclassified Nocardia TaxID=2637762 RepID=UPI001CE475E2|nr:MULTISPECIES: alpha/beta hydrolase [unclassified Nocardia]
MTLEGVTVGGMECGDRDGYPVVASHGAPGSHVEAVAFAHDAAREVGVRLIAIDRPGMGMSEFSPRRRILDWADTVTAIADDFELDKFAVLGASGGGPYALACAYRLPDRVNRAVIVSSPAPLDDQVESRGAGGVKRASGLMILRRFPFLARPVAARMAQVVRKPRGLAAMIARMSPADRDRLAGDEELRNQIADNVHTAFAHGSRGVAADFQVLFARPWGFDPADIVVPVRIWHGEADGNVPVADAERLAEAVPDSQLEIVCGAGHLLFVDHATTILRSIREDNAAESKARQPR